MTSTARSGKRSSRSPRSWDRVGGDAQAARRGAGASPGQRNPHGWRLSLQKGVAAYGELLRSPLTVLAPDNARRYTAVAAWPLLQRCHDFRRPVPTWEHLGLTLVPTGCSQNVPMSGNTKDPRPVLAGQRPFSKVSGGGLAHQGHTPSTSGSRASRCVFRALSSANVRSRYGPTVREAMGEDRGS